ncbi:hypothetical protein [Streptomyces boluensis]|uniref:Uncharacterized protein n=1 Tax=Streptomyces boluensis TaxID=1775135 RepID=A0A964UZA8_9ACTN|nr:hypothetical protein [Streptomyces boluensis]NBE55652.1 hypothetical protein [Streptomyces boluensis]
MEKRIDENAAPLHVHAASTDPGYIPGITPSKPVAPVAPVDTDAPVAPVDKEAEAEQDTSAAKDTVTDTAPDTEAEPEAGAEAGAEPVGASDEGAADSTEDAEDTKDTGDAEGAAGAGKVREAGPAFDARDHRGSITIDHTGLRFRLDDQEAEFDWDELGAVEHSTSRFGRRFTVTAHTLGRRAYPAEVQAPDKATLKRWTTELDVVLDAYFEE